MGRGIVPFIRFCSILERNSRSFARRSQALVISGRYFHTLASIVFFKKRVVVAASLLSCGVYKDNHCCALRAMWKSAEKIRAILLVEGVKYLTCKAIPKG